MADTLARALIYQLEAGDDVIVEWAGKLHPARVIKAPAGPSNHYVDVDLDGEVREIYFESVFVVRKGGRAV